LFLHPEFGEVAAEPTVSRWRDSLRGNRMRIPRHGSIESRWRASLLTITSALPAAARAKYLSSFGSWHSRTASVGSIRSRQRRQCRESACAASTETKRSNLGRKMTSRYSFSTSCERISRLGGSTARNKARSGGLSALRAPDTKDEASQ